ncbi:MAG: hypothetical protein LBB41_05920 [Prevotellaceae bacterium]|jgi:hypothetical protein|nr:hypothetical protein [Prevotellaceae bacterium]
MNFKEILDKIKDSEDFSDLKSSSVRDLLNGNIFLKKFFRRQYLLLLLVACLTFIYIDNRYYCEKQLKKSIQMTSELQDLRYESLVVSADLMKLSRQSNICRQINERGINIKESKTPPIIVR